MLFGNKDMKLRLFFLILLLPSFMSSKVLFFTTLGPTGMIYVNAKLDPFKDYREQLRSMIKQNNNISNKAFLLHINKLPRFRDVNKLQEMNKVILKKYPDIGKKRQVPAYDFSLDKIINKSQELDMIGLVVSPSKLNPNEILTKKAFLKNIKVNYLQYDISRKASKKIKIGNLRRQMMSYYERTKFSNMYGGLLEIYDFDNDVLTFYVLNVNPSALIKYLAE